MKRAADFRQSAREALRGKWGLALIACVIASLLGGATSQGVNFEFSFDLASQPNDATAGTEAEFSFSEFFSNIEPNVLRIMLIVGGVALVIGLVFTAVYFVLGSVVSLGYSKFNLLLIDGQEAKIGNLFEYFNVWKRAAVMQLLRTLYTFLWLLLFIIPGIIATYSYAMAPYIMAEFPEISPKEAIEASKKLMYGNKYRLFCLELSFIGWAVLCIFSFGIGYLWLNPYINAAKADFYREISGTRPKTDIPFDSHFDCSDESTKEANENYDSFN